MYKIFKSRTWGVAGEEIMRDLKTIYYKGVKYVSIQDLKEMIEEMKKNELMQELCNG